MAKQTFLIFLLIGSLTACTKAELASMPTLAATPAATTTATQEPLVTPTPSPTNTATATNTLTPTPTPTATPSPIPSPTSSLWNTDLVPVNPDFQVVNQLGGRINRVVVQDDIAYVGVGPRLWTLDISQPEMPVELGKSDVLPGLIQYIAVSNSTAYLLTDDETGFWIADISQPDQIQIVDFFETTVPINFLREWNGRLYVAPSSRDIDTLIFSLEAPYHPTLLGELPEKYYPSSDPDNAYVYSSTQNDGDQITISEVDATDIHHLKSVSEVMVKMDGGGYFIDVDSGQYYFLSIDGMPTIWVMDKQDSNSLTKLNIELSPYFRSIEIRDQIIYLRENFLDAGSYGSSVDAYDVSGSQVRQLENLSAGNKSYDLFVHQDIVYVATGESLIIAEITKDRNLEKLSEWRSLGDLDWIDAGDDQIFTLNSWDNRLYQFQKDSPQNLRFLYDYQEWKIDTVALGEDTIFTGGWFSGIHRYDYTTIPWQETAVFDRPFGIETVGHMTVHDGTLYASLDGDLAVFDVSDLAQIEQIGELNEVRNYSAPFAVEQGHLFSWVEGYGLKIIKITDPTSPEEIGLLPDESGYYLFDLAAHGKFLYLLTASCYRAQFECDNQNIIMRVVDATDLAHMTEVAQLPTINDVTFINIAGEKLLLGGDELWLVDITEPTQPQVNGRFPTPGYSRDAVLVNDLIYVADGAGGLLILQMTE
ncbi:MAG: hypothetical protein H6667_07365 [Ardenticatenaceae bacterium]|nr:hypothetical protein [Ardenticatenaceae bacterium]MCB9444102.1 hypothetical protein [Ardenticatenaceae bacterium]